MEEQGLSSARHPSALGGGGGPRHRRDRWIVLGAVLAAVSVLAALLAFGLSRDPTLIRSPLIGKAAPAFNLRTLGGDQTVDLAALRGQVVVINFWASWCLECRVEHGALAAAWDRYRDQRVVLLGIAFQDRATASLGYVRDVGGDWPQLADPGERTALAYGVYGVPETFVIGPDGRVAAKQVSSVTYPWLTEQIERLLPEAAR
jgi:cytochrome c biogenesis protein CcmG, thiol:disulfide interchange protein DsbE